MWLAWAGLRLATGKGERPGRLTPQLITLGAVLGLGAGVWFLFNLSAKLDFDQPMLLLLALIALPIFALGCWSLQQLGPARRWASVYLRVFVLLLIAALLAGFRTVQTHDELTVVALIDDSESVHKYFKPPPDENGNPQDYKQWVGSFVAKAGSDKPGEDFWAVQSFDGRPSVLLSPSRGEVKVPMGGITQQFSGSNVQRGIESAKAAKAQADSALRIVLFGDGKFDGDVMEAVRSAAAAGVPIDVVPLKYKVDGEVMIEAVRAPAEAREGQTIQVAVELRSAGRVSGQLQLKHNDAWVDLNPDTDSIGLPISANDPWTPIDAGEQAQSGRLFALTKLIPRPITESGVNTFDAVFIPDAGSGLANAIVSNDRGQAFTLVAGPGKVLVVDGVGGEAGRILPRALAARGINTEVANLSAIPSRLQDMRKYDAILFHNVPAENVVDPNVQDNLAKYVHNLGGGFAMIGGPDSFGAGGWTNTVIDKFVLPVSCQIPSQQVLPSGALVLVIDRSGSMSAPVAGSAFAQQNVAAEAAIQALSALYPQDMIGVVSFDSSAKWIVKLQYNRDPRAIADKIRAIGSGGGTNIAAGVEAGYQALKNLNAQDAAIKHMIVITDGQGSMPNNLQLGGKLAQDGITISTIGVGDGHNAQGLYALAQTGNGNYYPVVNPANLPQVFIKEARAIRKNLIKEQPFVPEIRSIGSPIMVGIDKVPELRGFVLTGPKPNARQQQFIFTPIKGPEGEPIFAHHQVGLGRAAAFTADATNRWAQDWLGDWGSSSSYADFWARTVRHIARPAASTQTDLTSSIAGDTLTLRLDAASESDFAAPGRQANFGNNLLVTGSVQSPDGTMTEVSLEQIGPGVYEAHLPAREDGNYIVDLQMQTADGERRRVIGGASKPAGGELRHFQSDIAMLQQIAEMTGGRVLDPDDPEAAGLFDRTTPISSRSTRPLKLSQLMPFILFVLLLDVACRRIAWEGREVADWSKARIAAVLGLMQTRKVESESTMAALKAKRQQTTERLAQHADAERGEASGPTTALGGLAARVKAKTNGQPDKAAPKPATSRTRKFVASEEDLAAAQDDFSAAVGGAKEGMDAKPIITAAMRKSEKQQEQTGPTTSRLLDAKRRAQERLKEQEDER